MHKLRTFSFISKFLPNPCCLRSGRKTVDKIQNSDGLGKISHRAFSFRMEISPLVEHSNDSTQIKRVERFGEYVVRQIQIPPDHATGPALAQAADDYLSGDKSKSDESRQNLIKLVFSASSEASLESKLAKELMDELDACMISYFAFHWKEAPLIIQQIFSNNKSKQSKLRGAVLSATRFQRIQKVTNNLKAQREISFLVEELKALKYTPTTPNQNQNQVQNGSNGAGKASLSQIVARASDLKGNKNTKRNPVIMLMGGGMGAGKSTVVKEVMKSPFWSEIEGNAVIVEADAFKEKDVIYKTLSNGEFCDITQASQLVHESSTRAASSMLVSALNQGRDVIFDGTMSWKPFVFQTIDMVRKVHNQRYRLGPGYQTLPDGSVSESYWVPVMEGKEGEGEGEEEEGMGGGMKVNDLPYKIELVGVVCDAHLAVVRGMRRTILTGRAVPVKGQLRSHKLFASSVEEYCQLVDKATIFSTNAIGGLPEIIASKEKLDDKITTTNSFSMVHEISSINENADNIFELFPSASPFSSISSPSPSQSISTLPSSSSSSFPMSPSLNSEAMEEGLSEEAFHALTTWEKVVRNSERRERQKRIRDAFTKLQACAWINPKKKGIISSANFNSNTTTTSSPSLPEASSIPDSFHDEYIFNSSEVDMKII